MINGTALRAERALMRLLLSLVRIQDVILLGMSGDAARGSWLLRPEIRLLHVGSMA